VPSNLFCFGLGYVAQRLSQHLSDWDITGTSRTATNLIPFSGGSAIDGQFFQRYNAFLISIPPHEQGDQVLSLHKDLFLTHKDSIRWIGYLSTTSVYGDHNGDYVDETTPPKPSYPRAQQRLLAENQWLDLYRHWGLPIHIFRLSGIYGPKRNVLQTITAGQGRIITKPDHVFSRIHVDDICQVLCHSLATPKPGQIYNLADDEPASSADVMAYGYSLLHQPQPEPIPFDQAGLSPMALEFYQDNKRINNAKIKEELGIMLHYPKYKDGLKKCWQEDYGAKAD
jgi:nucleoside-diphosphate-sugar epimerase